MIKFPFPYLTTGTIVHGFGRGSKELNCPTANLDASSIENLPVEIDEGVYFGWAQFLTNNNNELYKLVASVGTNPFYKCKVKTLEAHLMHNFETDFYGEKLKIVLLGEIRKMTSFKDANELAMAIQNDIVKAHHELDSDQSREYLNHPYFKN
ncbi:unnamed protein product [Rotaria magnacalcarata]|uniref:riboflavin kinase n=1 Tax=Rotaria magnacalcarata TaxID=392030 RepID=A0A816DV01_9BILA|nr:unnamed protein product [Rotaria magnacalcarata]CAF1639166.1 unnamed protein product [Rotaria magnacalcarata]CAF1938963.1 unnamed protein product [Rotaria magnacalcarata]CAF2032156.1 unnamed protein product [Rotaria magnacalcarata]CAF2150958.1 unnamed protein product [Rotaria magnacalcarata]